MNGYTVAVAMIRDAVREFVDAVEDDASIAAPSDSDLVADAVLSKLIAWGWRGPDPEPHDSGITEEDAHEWASESGER